ncbi:butyrophilin-like protein 9 isoform X2 [Antechinus flavipes]|uniref:butyrophilin-like protein 9 isoform X2 n=1 Tax=Antechinus flavipes TaxID=38775 RepID=UPI002235BF67|nr:butyrophilin-like protein 9 isoform X2 [Antechinus flavipes]
MECCFLLDLSFVLLVLLPWSVSGKFIVMGPQQPIIALVGEEAIFPCQLSPQTDAKYMDVKWFNDQNGYLVHRYKYNQDYLKHQHQEYERRTEFLRDDISNGSVALKLHHIRLSDEGKYRCFFESSYAYGEAEFQVHVAAKGSAPHIYIQDNGNKSRRVICTSTGWYPEPEVQWEKNQEKLSSQDTTIKRKENGLFSVETSITVFTNSTANVSCFIWNPRLGQKLEGANVFLSGSQHLSFEARGMEKLVVNGTTFSGCADALGPNGIPWKEICIVTVVLAVIELVMFIVILMRKKKGKDKDLCNVDSFSRSGTQMLEQRMLQ